MLIVGRRYVVWWLHRQVSEDSEKGIAFILKVCYDGGIRAFIMQDQNQTQNTQTTAAEQAAQETADAVVNRAAHGDYVRQIVEKIKNSENILVALSKNPSVDDIAAAIGLTLFLDGMQHHITAIYSGKTPAAIDFLQPEATFETNTASLQDFIIALNKDKADHLRYKLEGDFVKVFITPYRTDITEKDLTFSRGDYNVDFVIAIDVKSAGDLDEALSEHGRIMHDASIVDITTGAPGKFGEIEWSDPTASSVSEMVTKLIFAIQGQDTTLDQDVATALLTGIVAATERFSNNRTSSDTLSLASKLMTMGADQQMISANVLGNTVEKEPEPEPVEGGPRVPSPTTVPDPVMVGGTVVMPNVTAAPTDASTMSIPGVQGMDAGNQGEPTQSNMAQGNPAAQLAQTMAVPTGPEPAGVEVPEVTPTEPATNTVSQSPTTDYAAMMNQALAESAPAETGNTTTETAASPFAPLPEPTVQGNPAVNNSTMVLPGQPVEQPAGTVLPPPPTPPVGETDAMPPTLPPLQMPPKQ